MPELHNGTPGRRRVGLRAALLGSVAMLGVGIVAIDHPVVAQSTPPAVNAEPGVARLARDDSYADLVEQVAPAVVNVQVERNGGGEDEVMPRGRDRRGGTPFDNPDDMRRFFERFFGQEMPEGLRPGRPTPRRMMGEGSGFLISPDGLIVTNFHVAGEADKITVTMNDGSEYKATLKGADEKTDLALIKIEANKPLPYVRWGDSNKVRPGDKVIAVGNPFGLGGTVTAGIVSATGREIGSGPYDNFLQIDAPINRGNSGGPTFNLDGEVVGVNTAIFSPSGGSVGIGFAIASNNAQQVIADLSDDGKIERGWLGVAIQGVDEDLAKALKLDGEKGALVSRVESGSPAEKAGVKRGDVVLEFDGKPIDRVGDLSRLVAGVKAGTTSDLVVWRDGKRQTLKARIGDMPSRQEVAEASEPGSDEQPRLGLSLAPLTPELRGQLGLDKEVDGVVVTDVMPDSPAETKGIQSGDIIMSINQEQVQEPRQVAEAVREAQKAGEESVLLLIVRNGQQIFEAVPLAAS
jgi:serine protease Do